MREFAGIRAAEFAHGLRRANEAEMIGSLTRNRTCTLVCWDTGYSDIQLVGGQINASFLEGGHAHRIAFFYAPKILGGRDSKKAVAGAGLSRPEQFLRLEQVRWSTCGVDRLLTAQISNRG